MRDRTPQAGGSSSALAAATGGPRTRGARKFGTVALDGAAAILRHVEGNSRGAVGRWSEVGARGAERHESREGVSTAEGAARSALDERST